MYPALASQQEGMMDEGAYITIIAHPSLWPEIKQLAAKHGAEMGIPTALTSAAEAPNFPIRPDTIKQALEFVNLSIAIPAHALLLVVALQELGTTKGEYIEVRDAVTGKVLSSDTTSTSKTQTPKENVTGTE
jgi:hypothetical protein